MDKKREGRLYKKPGIKDWWDSRFGFGAWPALPLAVVLSILIAIAVVYRTTH